MRRLAVGPVRRRCVAQRDRRRAARVRRRAEVLEPADTLGSLRLDALFAAILLVFAVVGALIASRQPRNPIGWLFLVAGAARAAASSCAFGYAHYALDADPGSLPARRLGRVVSNWTEPAARRRSSSLLLLLFPDGRLPSPRWRLAALAVRRRHAARYVLAYGARRPGRSTSLPARRQPARASSGARRGSARSSTEPGPRDRDDPRRGGVARRALPALARASSASSSSGSPTPPACWRRS